MNTAAQTATPSGHSAPPSAAPVEPQGAINVRDAASQLEALLDDDGNSPDHDVSARDQVRDDLDTGDADQDDRNPPVEDVTDDDDDSDTLDLDGDDDTSDINDDPDTDDAEPLTFDQLAEELEVEPDDLKKLTISFNAAGEQVTLPLEEVIKGYQKDSDYRKSTAALAEERKTFTSTVKTQQETYTHQSTVLAQVMGTIENSIRNQVNSPQMQALRESDPSEWNARITEANQRLGNLNQLRQSASENFKKFQSDAQIAFLQTQGQILEKDVEGWGQEKLDAAQNVMRNYGFSDEEIPQIADARLIKAALAFDDVMKENAALKEQLAKGKKAAKRVKAEVPKTLKPGSRKTARGSKPNFQKAKERLRRTPTGKANTLAAAAAIEHLLTPVDN